MEKKSLILSLLLTFILSGCATPRYVCYKEMPKWAGCVCTPEFPANMCGCQGRPYRESDMIYVCEKELK